MENEKKEETQGIDVNLAPTVKLDDTMKAELKEMFAKELENVKTYQKKFNLTNTETSKAKLKSAEAKINEIKFINAVAFGRDSEARELVADRAKALNEATNASGGYLVPTTFETRVFEAVDEYSEIISNADVVTMTTDTQNLNSVITKVTVKKTAELGVITASNPTFGEPVLQAEKYTGSTTMSEELLEDAEIDVLNRVAAMFGEELAYQLQNSLVNSAISGSEGLLVVSGVQTVSMVVGGSYTNTRYADLRTMKWQLIGTDKYKAEGMRGKFYMAPETWDSYLKNMSSNATGNFFVDPFNGTPMKADSQDVVVLNEFPTPTVTGSKFVLYGDLRKHLVIGKRRAMRLKVNTSGTTQDGINLNNQDARELVMAARFAQVVVLPGGLVTLVT